MRAVGHLALPAYADLSDDSDEDVDTDERTPSSTHGTFLRNSGRPHFAKVWHEAIAAAADRELLAADAQTLAEHAAGQTFWIERGAHPLCSLERMALSVLRFHTGREEEAPGQPPVVGAEWWVQVRRSDGTPTILPHWDSDEMHKRLVGEHLPPFLATVTYLGSEGAPTVILPVAADGHGRAVRVGVDSALVSYPVPGKHLVFDGRMLHGALHDMQRLSDAPYVRISLLVNLWRGHTPSEAECVPALCASPCACVCMHACVPVCLSACVHVRICACVHARICACVPVCLCACVHVRMCAYVPVCMCPCVHVSMCPCVHVSMCACVHV